MKTRRLLVVKHELQNNSENFTFNEIINNKDNEEITK